MNRRDITHIALGCGIAVAALSIYQLGRASAQNIPSMPTMFYGVSLDENGAAVTGTRDLRVRFFDGEMSGTQLCETLANSTAVTQGRARIALSETCRTAVQQNASVWVELAVGGSVVGGRTRVGAVPFAVEALRANELTRGAQIALIPEGSIIAFGGPITNVPDGWLLCDGRSLRRDMYPALFNAIGTAHGGDGTNFNLPDYRGRFLRGVASGSSRDPERTSRIAANPGGNAGDAVGSVQGAATAAPSAPFMTSVSGAHSHLPRATGAVSGVGATFTAWSDVSSSPVTNVPSAEAGSHVHAVSTGGDPETRPLNAAVYYIIRH